MAERVLNREIIFRGRIVTLRLDQVELANGHVTTREIVEHPGSVVIVAIDNQERVLLVRQFRLAVESELLELPAGTLDKKGETPEAAAQRELLEETGYQARKWERLGRLYPSPGVSTEIMYLFAAWELEEAASELDPDETIALERYPLAEAVEQIARGEITDSKTVAGILLIAHRHRG